MKRSLLLSAFGKYQPGTIPTIAHLLYRNHCNIEDSSVTIVQDELTMTLVVSAPRSLSLPGLQEQFQEVELALDLSILLRETDRAPELSLGRPWSMRLPLRRE